MKTLFIDFDGTICHDRFWRSLPKDENQEIQDFLFSGSNSVVVDWMKGVYTSEEINQMIANETGLGYEYIWEAFVSDCKNMHVKKEILEAIKLLRKDFNIVLITGNMDCFTRFTVPSLQLQEYFDVIVNSFTERQLKTDENGYTFTKYLKGDVNDAILIEDSEKSCEIFSNLGGIAHRVIEKDDTLKYLLSL